MSFDYDTIRARKHESGTQWAAYSDLFMVLAFVFLLMYMVSSLRTGMISVTSHAQIEEVKQELKLYESVKNQYLEQESGEREKKIYNEILSQISLLETEANENKNRLAQESEQQRMRETSLNQYQQLIVEMINANTIAKAEASKKFISERQQKELLEKDIEQQSTELATLEDQLNMEVSEKAELKSTQAQETATLQSKIQDMTIKREQSLDQLAQLEEKLEIEAAAKAALEGTLEAESRSLETKIQELTENRAKAQVQLATLEQRLEAEAAEKAALESTLVQETTTLQGKIQELTSSREQNQNQLASLEQQLISGEAEKAALRKTLQQETKNLEGIIQELTGKQEESENLLASLEQKLRMEAADKADLEATLSKEKQGLEGQLEELSGKQNQSQAELASLAAILAKEAEEKAALKNASAEEIGELEEKFAALKGDYDKKQGELESLADDIESGKKEISDLEQAHASQLGELENQYQGLKDKYDGNLDKVAQLDSDLGAAQRNLKKTAENLSSTQDRLSDKSGELQEALQLVKRRQVLAKKIQDNFYKNGIAAEVDGNSGDVILDFGEDYFETNSHQLKTGMEKTIRKAIPVYAQSLFADESLNSKISSVEIIGFASPTFGGKPVDPRNMSEENRKAINYNLDLSYKRARSIFRFAFDTGNFRFDYQDTMLPLLNVTGRSFFAEDIDPNDLGNLTIDEFCGQYNCSKSQRVIIKFGLQEKGES